MLVVAAAIIVAAIIAWFVHSTIPRRIVLATGPVDGLHHELAQHYQAILARNGVTVVERVTSGAEENAKLLRDPASGVDVAFMLGGVVPPAEHAGLEMLASLYFEPLWVFYRGEAELAQLDDLRYKRIAIGAPGQGVRPFVEPLLTANNVTGFNSELVAIGNVEALGALQAGRVDAICLLGAVTSPRCSRRCTTRAQADEPPARRRVRAAVPASRCSPARRGRPRTSHPGASARLFGTEAMLVAREGLAPDRRPVPRRRARAAFGPGPFREAQRVPSIEQVDLPVSVEADRHLRFGPSLSSATFRSFVATYVERLAILLVPVLFLIVPLINWLPQLCDARPLARVYRWYGELTLLERDVDRRQGDLPIARWLADLDRIEHAAAHIRLPSNMASEGTRCASTSRWSVSTILSRREAARER